MTNIFTPADILSDGEDYTMAVNPFTGFQGKARKGTVAATLKNIALLDKLFLEDDSQNQIEKVKKVILELIPSLKATGIFDLFNLTEWIGNPKYLGRTYVALLYLKTYPDEIDEAISLRLQEISKTTQNVLLQSEIQSFCKK